MDQARILVVEDEAIVAKDMQMTLRGLGYAVPALAHSGEDAISKAREVQPDLILMDIHLRGRMDGIEAAERIRAEADVPVIYVTAYSDKETLERAKITSPIGYIVKPFEERDLHTTIEMALYRHTMEKRVRESEQWLAITLNSIGDAVIATDTEGCITFMNRVAEMLTGYQRAEAIGKLFPEVVNLVDEDTRAAIDNPIQRALDSGLIVNLSKRCLLVSRDGIETPVDDSASPIGDEHGRTFGVVMVLQDVSERRKAEEALKESEKRFRTIFENANDEIVLLDDMGTIIDVNDRIEEIFGWKREEVIDKTVFDIGFLDPEGMHSIAERFAHAVDGDLSNLVMLDARRKDGSAVFIEASVRLLDHADHRNQILVIIRDITERRQAEQEIRQKNEDLTAADEELRGLLQALEEQNGVISASQTELAEALESTVQSEEELKEKNEELMALEEELREINQHLEEMVQLRTAEIRQLLQQKEEFISQTGARPSKPANPYRGSHSPA